MPTCGVKTWRQVEMLRQTMGLKCRVRHKCGGASEMWRQTMRPQNVASDAHVAAGGNVASNNVVSKCGVRHRLDQTVFHEMCIQWQA